MCLRYQFLSWKFILTWSHFKKANIFFLLSAQVYRILVRSFSWYDFWIALFESVNIKCLTRWKIFLRKVTRLVYLSWNVFTIIVHMLLKPAYKLVTQCYRSRAHLTWKCVLLVDERLEEIDEVNTCIVATLSFLMQLPPSLLGGPWPLRWCRTNSPTCGLPLQDFYFKKVRYYNLPFLTNFSSILFYCRFFFTRVAIFEALWLKATGLNWLFGDGLLTGQISEVEYLFCFVATLFFILQLPLCVCEGSLSLSLGWALAPALMSDKFPDVWAPFAGFLL